MCESRIMRTIKEAESIVGTLSKPDKMPCYSYSIPAWFCKIGMKMRKVIGSICSKCYALKGHYVFPNVKAAQEKRFHSLIDPRWVSVMTFLIQRKEKSGFFRWHDAGDLQDSSHLQNIITIAENLPEINFWLPTREYNIVNEYIRKNGREPENLTVRLSSLMFDGDVTKRQNPFDLPTSGASKEGFNCPSSKQGNKCLDCRACWDKAIPNIIYKEH